MRVRVIATPPASAWAAGKNQFRAALTAFIFEDDKLHHSANKIAHNQSMRVFGHKESHRPAWVVALLSVSVAVAYSPIILR
jgi:hypothetical protein